MRILQLVMIMKLFSKELISLEATKTASICQEMLIGLSNCCAGTVWNDQKKKCVQCDPGFKGLNCSKRCPAGFFGRQCQSICPRGCNHCHHDSGECQIENASIPSSMFVNRTTMEMMEVGGTITTEKSVQNTSIIITIVTGGSLIVVALFFITIHHIIMIVRHTRQTRFNLEGCTLQNESPVYEEINENQILQETALPEMRSIS